ncbi:MAG: LamG domain-containing protein [Pseudomonadota bacterium]|nr:LamG domain-containing protein [Pseudomonadota bacterium]
MNALKRTNKRTWLAALGLLVTLILTGCGGGASNETNAQYNNGFGGDSEQVSVDTSPYTGPVCGHSYSGDPTTAAEVCRFKQYFYDELRVKTCGGCHNGDQSPVFLAPGDVDQAYNVARSYINRTNPGSSEFVAKVAGGHHCWINGSDAACGSEMTDYIERWLNGVSSSSTEIQLSAPTEHDITVTKQIPVTGGDDYLTARSAFSTYIYPLFAQYSCDTCHRSDAGVNAQQPYFASADMDEAYEASRSRIDIEDSVQDRSLAEALSRFVVRQRSEFHNCGETCMANAQEMLDAIKQFEAAIPAPVEVPDTWITSRALILERDGIIASGGGRIDTGAIAMWEFDEGDGALVLDKSGVEPQMNLDLYGDYNWVGGNGIQFLPTGKAQATTTASRKLSTHIKSSGAYSLEAWVAPANVTQEGPARIMTYSDGNTSRNFTLGQTLYNYDFLHRSSSTDGNGQPALSTADADERLQATLQHVVLTFDPVNGRSIYVNGQHTGDMDSVAGGSVSGWDDGFVFIMGNEASGDHQWEGIVRFAAVYDRALTAEEIATNFEAGVGEKYFLLFKLEHCSAPGSCYDLTGINDGFDSYVVFEAAVFDSYSYLFSQPFLYRLRADGTAADAQPSSYTGVPLEGMRIGINGKEPDVGQAYAKLVTTLESGLYTEEAGQVLSDIGTILPMEGGSNADEFFLTFEQIGSDSDVRVEASFSPTAPAVTEQEPDVGLRNFAEINYSMAKITGVPVTNSNVVSTYETVKQQLPTTTSAETFLSSHQMAVAQMAIEYCSELVDSTGLRGAFFPGFDFSAGVNTAFDTTLEVDAVIDPLYANVVGSGLLTQPDESAMKTELESLIQTLVGNAVSRGETGSVPTQKIVKATCAAALGSAAVLVQ